MKLDYALGRVISVAGNSLRVELFPEVRSYFRSTEDGTELSVGVGTLLTFDLGAGTIAVGVAVRFDAHEKYAEKENEAGLVVSPKSLRIISVQLLGRLTAPEAQKRVFHPGITSMPTLDTVAEIASKEIRDEIFSKAPMRHRPFGSIDLEYDSPILIGHTTGLNKSEVYASFNDLFSRPLAIVGNTGSGKSCAVASLLGGVTRTLGFSGDKPGEPHTFILDINGEYTNVFFPANKSSETKKANRIYLNGNEFALPAWLMNCKEICQWLRAAPATQEPALKNWWGNVKGKLEEPALYNSSFVALCKIENALRWLDRSGKKTSTELNGFVRHAKSYPCGVDAADWEKLEQLLANEKWVDAGSNVWAPLIEDKPVRDELFRIRELVQKSLADEQQQWHVSSVTADEPRYVAYRDFQNPNFANPISGLEQDNKIDEHLVTLKLRLRTRLEDKRWRALFNYDDLKVQSYDMWLKRIGIGECCPSRIAVFDLSMLASEVLPLACAILGRILLDIREGLKPSLRNAYPWVLVLEEAHNYASPFRPNESPLLDLSRDAFERVAKEGRKFGLSFIVTSQRPSEISPTIISQCANFMSHRLQNPDDIGYLRKIVPTQVQQILDQITILDSGECLLFGSSIHVPCRVQVLVPSVLPQSTTPAPFIEWKSKTKLGYVACTELSATNKAGSEPGKTEPAETNGSNAESEDIPF